MRVSKSFTKEVNNARGKITLFHIDTMAKFTVLELSNLHLMRQQKRFW